jgi:hypothetical protein
LAKQLLKIKFFMNLFLFALLLFFTCFLRVQGNEIYVTSPPKGWECIDDPTQLPQKVKVIYIGKGNKTSQFTPSINVAAEPTYLPLKEYVTIAKRYHEGQGGTQCFPLGKIKTESGDAELLQIDRLSQWGSIRFLQAMVIKEGVAYVVTATCLKNEFNSYSSQIFKAIQSLKVPERVLSGGQ